MQLREEAPPRLVYSKVITASTGARRAVSGALEVHDALLAERIRSELKRGDRIEFTEETHWGEPGIPTILLDYRKI